MALFRLPSGFPDNEINSDIVRRIELEGTFYEFKFLWNSRDESWSVTCSGIRGNIIFHTKATVSRVLNRNYKHREGCPQGDLILIDTTGFNGRASFQEFHIGGRFRLMYLESNGVI